MQPYFLPHFSYFQLIANTDIFCLHDKLKYTKQSWINRNRIILNKKVSFMTMPVKSGSDFEKIDEKQISSIFNADKLLNSILFNYRNSPNVLQVTELLEKILKYESKNLLEYLINSVKLICNYLDIDTKIVKSSDTLYDSKLLRQEMIIDICKKLKGGEYVNSAGGITLYDPEVFLDHGIQIRFLKTYSLNHLNNVQSINDSLSILDSLMWFDKKLLVSKLYEIEYLSI